MTCYLHTELPAVAYCRTCGKPLCEECKRAAQGTVFCEEHAPAASPAAAVVIPAAMSPQSDISPGLACFLGFIPGVGAIYNGQYAKGLVHAVIFGLLISITASSSTGDLEPLFGILIPVWVLYMAIEAYHTAKKRKAGEPIDEFSSVVNLRGKPGGFPAGAVLLIVLGVVLLMNTLEIVQFRHLVRFWPVLLILAGVYMLYTRVSSRTGSAEPGGQL
jgi:TM2 domain-containing membrane protein YozV